MKGILRNHPTACKYIGRYQYHERRMAYVIGWKDLCSPNAQVRSRADSKHCICRRQDRRQDHAMLYQSLCTMNRCLAAPCHTANIRNQEDGIAPRSCMYCRLFPGVFFVAFAVSLLLSQLHSRRETKADCCGAKVKEYRLTTVGSKYVVLCTYRWSCGVCQTSCGQVSRKRGIALQDAISFARNVLESRRSF